MMSTLTFLTLLIIELTAAIVASVPLARWQRGRQATWRRGVELEALLFVVGLCVAGGIALAVGSPAGIRWSVALAGFFGYLWVTFVAYRRGYGLTNGGAAWTAGGSLGVGLLVQIAVVLSVRPYLVESFIIPTEGMSPTLAVGDCITVFKPRRPGRFDVIAYIASESPRQVYCQRIVGLPGERLRFEGTLLYVNDKATPLPAVYGDRTFLEASGPAMLYADGQTITLGDEYFVLGDNLGRSYDSRYLGEISTDRLVGVVDLRYWPLTRLALLR